MHFATANGLRTRRASDRRTAVSELPLDASQTRTLRRRPASTDRRPLESRHVSLGRRWCVVPISRHLQAPSPCNRLVVISGVAATRCKTVLRYSHVPA